MIIEYYCNECGCELDPGANACADHPGARVNSVHVERCEDHDVTFAAGGSCRACEAACAADRWRDR